MIKYFLLPLCVFGVLMSGCGDSGHKKKPYLHTWERPQYQPGGSNALVYFVLYVKFQEGAEVSAKTYRTGSFPEGVELQHFTRKQLPEFPFTQDIFAKTAGKNNPALFDQIKAAPECLVFRGEVRDPRNLDYLRDLVGLIMFSLDHGAIAVMDVQQVKLFDPVAWRMEIFQPDPPNLRKHVTILVSDEPDGTHWLHTRGMRKFGRPDLSFHKVGSQYEQAAIDLLNRFILLQAQGGLIPENKEIQSSGLPAGLTCHHEGSLDDPDFNNVHVEIRWPAK